MEGGASGAISVLEIFFSNVVIWDFTFRVSPSIKHPSGRTIYHNKSFFFFRVLQSKSIKLLEEAEMVIITQFFLPQQQKPNQPTYSK